MINGLVDSVDNVSHMAGGGLRVDDRAVGLMPKYSGVFGHLSLCQGEFGSPGLLKKTDAQ